MRKLKAFIISIIIVALLGVSAYAGLNYVKKLNENEVIVVSVGSIASDYYTQDTSLDGYITSNVSQTVYQDSDMIVDKVHVSAGDSVKKGDTCGNGIKYCKTAYAEIRNGFVSSGKTSA